MQQLIQSKVFPAFLLAVGFVSSLQTPALACGGCSSGAGFGNLLFYLGSNLLVVCGICAVFGLMCKGIMWFLDRHEVDGDTLS